MRLKEILEGLPGTTNVLNANVSIPNNGYLQQNNGFTGQNNGGTSQNNSQVTSTTTNTSGYASSNIAPPNTTQINPAVTQKLSPGSKVQLPVGPNRKLKTFNVGKTDPNNDTVSILDPTTKINQPAGQVYKKSDLARLLSGQALTVNPAATTGNI
jgi:hypothetical protein